MSRKVLASIIVSGCVLISCSKKVAPTPALSEVNPNPAASSAANQPNPDLGNKTPEQALTEAIKIALDTVYFGFDSYTLSSEANANLKNMANALKVHPDARIGIEGHSDSRGSPEYNLALSEKRANTIKAFLISEGVDAKKLEVTGKGEEQPAVQGDGESAWAKNRRGEFTRL